MNGKNYERLRLLGPQNGDPVCPCRMKNGYFPAPQWTRFPAVENDLQYSDRPRNGPAYTLPIIFCKESTKSQISIPLRTAVSAIWATVQVPKPTQSVAEPVLTVSPDSMDVTDMLELEGMSPVDGYDEIYKHYATTFGRTPDAFMQKVVEETKQRLLMWFFSHRETIRAALFLQESTEKTSTTPTTQTTQTTSAAQQAIDDITRSNGREASPHQHQGSEMTVADQVARAMRFRSAHGAWLARMIYEVRAGRTYRAPEPKIEDFT